MSFRIYVEGPENRCHTCLHLKVRSTGREDWCNIDMYYIDRKTKKGCTAWSRDYEIVC